MGQQFTETAHKDGDGLRVVSIAQTRNGNQEWITPTALWELDDATGLYLPPGESANPRKPRVEATLSGSLPAFSQTPRMNVEGAMWESVTLVNAQAITDTNTRNVSLDTYLARYERISFAIVNTLAVQVAVRISRSLGNNPWTGPSAADRLFPEVNIEAGNSAVGRLVSDAIEGWERLNDGIPSGVLEYRALSAPSSGSLTIILRGLKKGVVPPS